jgi:hypothetical protein
MSAKWWMKTAALGIMLALVCVTTMAQSNGPSTRGESVVVPITAAATKFQKAIGDGLGQKLEELKTVIKEASTRVRAALEVAQRDGTDDANTKYEDVVSGELEHVQQALQAVGAEKAGVMTAQRELSEQLDKLRGTLVQRQATLARQVRERDGAVEQLNAQLVALAVKNQTKVESGTPLSAEDDLQARALAQQLALAQQQQALTTRAGQDAENRLTKLRGFDGQLSTAGGEYGLLFDKANGQVRLIGQLAEMRREGVEVGAVIGQMNKVAAQLAVVSSALDDTSATIDDLVAAPILGDQTSAAMPNVVAPRTSGIDILKKVLDGRKDGGVR